MASFNKYTGPTLFTYDIYAHHNEYLKDNTGNQLYLGFEQGDSYIGNIDNFNENNATSSESNCGWTIDPSDSFDTTKTGQKIIIDISETDESRNIQFYYNSTLLFSIYQDATKMDIITFYIIAEFLEESRLLDDTSDDYDVYISTKSISVSQSLPFTLNICVNLVYDSTLEDGSIDLYEQIESYDWYINANTTTGIPQDISGYDRPSVILNRGNGGCGFHSIQFLNIDDTPFIGPGSAHTTPTQEYVDIIYNKKIYRCTNVQFTPSALIYFK